MCDSNRITQCEAKTLQQSVLCEVERLAMELMPQLSWAVREGCLSQGCYHLDL